MFHLIAFTVNCIADEFQWREIKGDDRYISSNAGRGGENEYLISTGVALTVEIDLKISFSSAL